MVAKSIAEINEELKRSAKGKRDLTLLITCESGEQKGDTVTRSIAELPHNLGSGTYTVQLYQDQGTEKEKVLTNRQLVLEPTTNEKLTKDYKEPEQLSPVVLLQLMREADEREQRRSQEYYLAMQKQSQEHVQEMRRLYDESAERQEKTHREVVRGLTGENNQLREAFLSIQEQSEAKDGGVNWGAIIAEAAKAFGVVPPEQESPAGPEQLTEV